MKHLLLPALVVLSISRFAAAADGQWEISQHCVSFGCFPGDSPGLPVEITQRGSYTLTSNLTTADVNQSLITVADFNVSIDLNGFSLIGPISCSGSPNACSGSGSGVGVRVNSGMKGFRLVNGTIRGMGSSGLAFLGHGARSVYIGNVSFIENAQHGISSGTGTSGDTAGLAENIVALRNGARGIGLQAANQLFVRDSTSQDNGTVHQGGQNGGYCANNVFRGRGTSAGSVMNCKSLGNNFCEWDSGSGSC